MNDLVGKMTIGEYLAKNGNNGFGAIKLWNELGLNPVEVAVDDLTQRITITHDALTDTSKWKTEKMDGVQALGIMTQTLYSMFEYFVKSRPHPNFSSGKAKVAIMLDGNELTIGLDPLHDPVVIKGILMAALIEVIQRSTDDGMPKDWTEIFTVENGI